MNTTGVQSAFSRWTARRNLESLTILGPAGARPLELADSSVEVGLGVSEVEKIASSNQERLFAGRKHLDVCGEGPGCHLPQDNLARVSVGDTLELAGKQDRYCAFWHNSISCL